MTMNDKYMTVTAERELDAKQERELKEALEAIERQKGGPFDRGDGAIIIETLTAVLQAIKVRHLVYRRLM